MYTFLKQHNNNIINTNDIQPLHTQTHFYTNNQSVQHEPLSPPRNVSSKRPRLDPPPNEYECVKSHRPAPPTQITRRQEPPLYAPTIETKSINNNNYNITNHKV